jgi:hypothetical protein
VLAPPLSRAAVRRASIGRRSAPRAQPARSPRRGGGATVSPQPEGTPSRGRRAARRPRTPYNGLCAALVRPRREGAMSSGCRCPVTHRRVPSTCGRAPTTPVSGFPVGGLPIALLTCWNETRRCVAQGAPWTENLAEARRVAPSGGIRSEHEDPPSRRSEPDSGKYSIHLEIGRGCASPCPRPAVTSRLRGW